MQKCISSTFMTNWLKQQASALFLLLLDALLLLLSHWPLNMLKLWRSSHQAGIL